MGRAYTLLAFGVWLLATLGGMILFAHLYPDKPTEQITYCRDGDCCCLKEQK